MVSWHPYEFGDGALAIDLSYVSKTSDKLNAIDTYSMLISIFFTIVFFMVCSVSRFSH